VIKTKGLNSKSPLVLNFNSLLMNKNTTNLPLWFIEITKVFSFVLLSFFVNSCTTKINPEFNIVTLQEKSIEGLLYYSDHIQSSYNSTDICFYNSDNHALIWYNIPSGKSNMIKLPDSPFSIKNPSAPHRFFALSKDSVFYLSEDSMSLYLFNTQSNNIQKINSLHSEYLPVFSTESSLLIDGNRLMFTWFKEEVNFGKREERLKYYH